MQIIKAPINPNVIGSEVQNLQNVLLLLLDNQIIVTFQPPDSPDEAEIIKLREALAEEYKSGFFGDATQQLARYFQLQQGLGDSYKGAVEETTAGMLNKILQTLGVLNNYKNQFVVKGSIRNHKGEGISALVKAYDRDLRSMELLGETTTNETGYYELKYGTHNFKNAEKNNADLMMEVFNTNGQSLLISDIFYNAAAVEEIDLTLPPPPAPPEWELLNEQILPLLTGQLKDFPTGGSVNITDLKPEVLNESDLEFINKETGIDINLLRLWSLAYLAGSQEIRIIAEDFYGWFRMGLPLTTDELFAISWNDVSKTDDINYNPFAGRIERFVNAKKAAATKNIISNSIIGSGFGLPLFEIMLDHIIIPSKYGEPASLGDLLEVGGFFDDYEKKTFARHVVYIRAQYSITEDFYRNIQFFYFNGKIDQRLTILRTVVALDSLTQHYLPLIQMLFTSMPNVSYGNIVSDLPSVVKNDIRSLSMSGLELVQKVGAPLYFEGSDQTEKELNYINYLDNMLNIN